MADHYSDQADGLRRLLSAVSLQFVSLTSAQPEPGRPWAVLNLAAAMRLAGVGVLVIDAAAGVPGGLMVGHEGHELADVLGGRCSPEAAVLPGPEGIPVMPARTGLAGLAGDSPAARRFAERLHALPGGIEVLLVNLPAGLDGTQFSPELLRHEVVVTASPQRDSLTASYRLLKELAASGAKRQFRLLVTGTSGAHQARDVHRSLAAALQRWAGARLDLLGVMPVDEHLRHAASQGRVLVASEPQAAAASNFRRMADLLIRLRSRSDARARAAQSQFSWADAVGLASPSMRG